MSTLLYIASEQVWPCILSVANFRPERLILLHSADEQRSKGPAQRLRRFFDHTGLLGTGSIRLIEISDSNVSEIEHALDELRLDLSNVAVDFTGGNKLMSLTVARWAIRRGVPARYVERGGHVFTLQVNEGEVVSVPCKPLATDLVDGLDPVDVIRCQLGSGDIEREGELLQMVSGRLEKHGKADGHPKEGDRLEYMTARALLKLGVRRVRRSIRLKVKNRDRFSGGQPVAELDLVFIAKGRLWVVDCKDSKRPDSLADLLRPYISFQKHNKAFEIFGRIKNALALSQTKALKEDLLHTREIAGLLGQAIAVRREMPDTEIAQFARDHGIYLVSAESLERELDMVLRGDRGASKSELETLVQKFGK